MDERGEFDTCLKMSWNPPEKRFSINGSERAVLKLYISKRPIVII